MTVTAHLKNRPDSMPEGALVPSQVTPMVGHKDAPQSRPKLEEFAAVVDRLHFGVLFVNANGTVQWHNTAAKHILQSRDGLTIDGAALRAATSEATSKLRMEIAAAQERAATGKESDAVVMLDRPSGKRRLAVFIAPHPGHTDENTATIVLYVIDPETAPPGQADTWQAMYGLTRSEVQLLQLLVDGFEVRDAASKLGVSYDTARTRLANIFNKTGTGRQPELMRLMLLTTPPRLR